MADKIQIKFDVVPTSPENPLALVVKLNDTVVWQCSAVTSAAPVTVEVDDADDTEHNLQLIVSGKKPEYTKIDANGSIVEDSMIQITNLTMDDLDMADHMHHFATYTHDCNGTAEVRTEPMYQHLGCNGTAEIKFTTPIYLWLLDHM